MSENWKNLEFDKNGVYKTTLTTKNIPYKYVKINIFEVHIIT